MTTLLRFVYATRSSFWFLPSLIVAAAMALALLLGEAEALVDPRLLQAWPQVFGAGVEGARSLLGVVASSMLSVAGVVFSVTLVALSLASSQYSSRVLRTFMRDRVNQTVLGVFLGIFTYSLVVLRTLEEGSDAVVPTLAVLCGLILSIVGVAFLVVFIHHISVSIQASQIIAALFKETLDAVERLFPEQVGRGGIDGPPPTPDEAGRTWHRIGAPATGYIQQVDASALLAFARKHGTIVRMEQGVGDFAVEGMPVASVLAAEPPDERDARRLGRVFRVGRQRTVEQDAAFGIQEIVDVALKALSPGVNDTTTAVICVDYLTAILVRLSDRTIESPYRFEDGELRVLARGPSFDALVGGAFDPIRQNASGNAIVLTRLLHACNLLSERSVVPARRRVFLEQAKAVAEAGRRTVAEPMEW